MKTLIQAQILRLIIHLSHQSLQNVDNSTDINEIIQSLDDHITEIAYNETVVQLGFDPVDLILRRQREEANQAEAGEVARDARDATDAIAAIDASAASVTSDAIVAIDTRDASPPAYSPTRAWMYEPIIALDSDSDAQ